jgi:hypothetical protein
MASPAEEGHVAMLTEFYAKHDSSKTAAQIQKLAAKHAGGGKFETLCGKMKQKYGESPREVWEAVQREAAGGIAQTVAAAEGEGAGPSGWEQEEHEEQHTVAINSGTEVTTREGSLDKQKDDTWKQRYCELVVDGEQGPCLVYRQKAGKRELGRALLTGARLSQSTESERAVFTVVDVEGVQFTFGSADSAEVAGWVDAFAQTGALSPPSPSARQVAATSAPAPVPAESIAAPGTGAGTLVPKEGFLDKQKDDTWKQRYCELVADGEQGPCLVYRQKAGKRELGRALLTGARLSQSTEGERAVFTVVDVEGVQFTFGSADSAEVRLLSSLGALPVNLSSDAAVHQIRL